VIFLESQMHLRPKEAASSVPQQDDPREAPQPFRVSVALLAQGLAFVDFLLYAMPDAALQIFGEIEGDTPAQADATADKLEAEVGAWLQPRLVRPTLWRQATVIHSYLKTRLKPDDESRDSNSLADRIDNELILEFWLDIGSRLDTDDDTPRRFGVTDRVDGFKTFAASCKRLLRYQHMLELAEAEAAILRGAPTAAAADVALSQLIAPVAYEPEPDLAAVSWRDLGPEMMRESAAFADATAIEPVPHRVSPATILLGPPANAVKWLTDADFRRLRVYIAESPWEDGNEHDADLSGGDQANELFPDRRAPLRFARTILRVMQVHPLQARMSHSRQDAPILCYEALREEQRAILFRLQAVVPALAFMLIRHRHIEGLVLAARLAPAQMKALFLEWQAAAKQREVLDTVGPTGYMAFVNAELDRGRGVLYRQLWADVRDKVDRAGFRPVDPDNLAQGEAAEAAAEAVTGLLDEVGVFVNWLDHLDIAGAGAEDAARIIPRLQQMYGGGT
jgi:hypothetical protein